VLDCAIVCIVYWAVLDCAIVCIFYWVVLDCAIVCIFYWVVLDCAIVCIFYWAVSNFAIVCIFYWLLNTTGISHLKIRRHRRRGAVSVSLNPERISGNWNNRRRSSKYHIIGSCLKLSNIAVFDIFPIHLWIITLQLDATMAEILNVLLDET
jgi:hypothetical protein